MVQSLRLSHFNSGRFNNTSLSETEITDDQVDVHSRVAVDSDSEWDKEWKQEENGEWKKDGREKRR